MSNLFVVFTLFVICLILGLLLQEFLLIKGKKSLFDPLARKWGFWIGHTLRAGIPLLLALLAYFLIGNFFQTPRNLDIPAIQKTITRGYETSPPVQDNFFQTEESLIGFNRKYDITINFSITNLPVASGNLLQFSPWEENFQIALAPNGLIYVTAAFLKNQPHRIPLEHVKENSPHTLKVKQRSDNIAEIQVDDGPWKTFEGSVGLDYKSTFQCRVGAAKDNSPGFEILKIKIHYTLGGVVDGKIYRIFGFLLIFWGLILFQRVPFQKTYNLKTPNLTTRGEALIAGLFGFSFCLIISAIILVDFIPIQSSRRIFFYLTVAYASIWAAQHALFIYPPLQKYLWTKDQNRIMPVIIVFVITIPIAAYHGTVLLFSFLLSLKDLIHSPFSKSDLLPWVQDLWDTTKPVSLATFCLAISVAFFTIIICGKTMQKKWAMDLSVAPTSNPKQRSLILPFLGVIGLMTIFFKITGWGYIKTDSTIFFILAVAPVVYFFNQKIYLKQSSLFLASGLPNNTKIFNQRGVLFCSAATILSLVILFHHDFKSLYQSPLKNINEFQVLQDYPVAPDDSLFPLVQDNQSVKLHPSSILIQWANQKPRNNICEYDVNSQTLYRISKFSELDSEWLLAYADVEEKKNIQRFLNSSTPAHTMNPTSNVFFFTSQNILHTQRKTMVGYFFHHQVHLFYPLWRYHLTQKVSHLNTQYGWLFTTFLYKFSVLGEDTLRFDHFVLRSASLYFFFICISIAFAMIFFRGPNLIFGLLGLLILFLCIYQLGFQNIQLAPGFIPFRQIFPLLLSPLILATWSDSHRVRTTAVVSLVPLLIIAIFWNRETGIFLTLAVIGSKITETLFRLSKFPLRSLIQSLVFMIPLGAIFFFPHTNENRASIYYLLGIGLPPTPTFKISILVFLFCVSIGLISILHFFYHALRALPFLFFLYIYFSISLIYYVWNPAPNHLWSTLLTSWFIVSYGFQIVLGDAPFSRLFKQIVIAVFLVTITICCLFARSQSNSQKFQFENEFASHKNFNWNTGVLAMESTADPKDISKEKMMIEKYLPEGTTMTLLSMEDVFYPLLFNRIPSFSLATIPPNLITHKDINDLKSNFANLDSDYIFIDSALKSPSILQVAVNSPTRLSLMRQFYNTAQELTQGYKVCETGKYLTVWKKIRTPVTSTFLKSDTNEK